MKISLKKNYMNFHNFIIWNINNTKFGIFSKISTIVGSSNLFFERSNILYLNMEKIQIKR